MKVKMRLRLLAGNLHLVDVRFTEVLEDEWKAHSADRYVHPSVYFLYPDLIVSPSVSGPPAPPFPRARTTSFSQPEQRPRYP
ncbi:uncharacterized protein LACBIDRAFT_309346 [Laccaria bicolor S238N-H82]|uniref:Predicted protein n=1 Tax=Laccaria bicolor (strain S238N-H82 / ATCC MYA-4686) TaxID=486041 RepID=B0DJB2_LACBS|nr:uncharacterized protein LACBIDRAFT_303306 [Laccaria bicolor S238N-H82]XP_001891162.1 uncharacterized protein LACBIDRAFT_309346 [Laccaria bicolor S238N-H82]EDQ98186.1 predicted protein [Laccaria bicolor S238N-H82]EDR05492.1 predicted protein [Laccaria bicolor S238N-H82]|eukprot:XP_001884050.1 predicted protein [Laccaria bicolor S238N-H82]